MSVYRLYRRDPIIQGRWYYALRCKGCTKLAYILDDDSGGKAPVLLVGDGQFSVPCLACGHDDLYQVSEVFNVQADQDMPGARPPRVKPSPSSRKPLLKAYPSAKATFGVGYIEDRPRAAVIVARIVTGWADIEVQCARLLAKLMGTNIPAAAAVFNSLRSSRAQHDALEAAAATVLNKDDYNLFAAYMARKASLEKERNDLAHGCFGVSLTIPDHIIWVSQSDFISFSAETKSEIATEKFRSKQFVYEIGTLERIAQEIEEYYHQLGFFTGYLGASSSFRATRYPQLCSQSHIRQALHQILSARSAPLHTRHRGKRK